MKKYLTTSLLTLTLLLGACASDSNEGAPEESEATNGPARSITYSLASDIQKLDPHTENVVVNWKVGFNVYDRLVTQNESMDLEPGLATEWNTIDPTTWEFKLREDVTFHDGTEFNADAVKANLERSLAEETISPTAYLYDRIEEVEVVDDYTVRFHLSEPFASLPAHLAQYGGSMLSPEVIEEDNEAVANGADPGSVVAEKPIGTGPFKFVSWNPGSDITLERNEDYWDGVPEIEGVTYKIVPEELTRVADLETQASDIIDSVNPNSIDQINNSDAADVLETDSTYVNFLGFNTNKEPFDDVRVRQAISMAIDKDVIVESILNNVGTAANSPLSPNDFGFADIEGLPYDPDAAKDLLEEAGQSDLTLELSVNDDRTRVDIATYIQQALEEIGVTVEISQMEFASFVEYTGQGEADLYLLGRSSPTGDGYNALFTILHSNKQSSNQLRYTYANPEFDALVDQSIQTEDETERTELFKEAQEIVANDVPFDFLYYPVDLLGVSNQISGVKTLPSGVVLLKDVKVAE
ncbi:glutathione ABC transporter substrate-binding protein [Alkalicoccobacillus murimartini]|uniref:Peptide/nickel transport system substrate-binding protein n=1 Tax=Alkalicoccobacillus murimartini TaxID=171685 RepID=A0ABT9YD48_9BACI|nr:glutathione ABC transporter substrate-binding protein [Alkalicoccobacillus murimartini]MDQ0205742.1 peptide/nickel transport system substrate-binding protein [Alkalicoccobacillus murimartini]